MPIAGSRSMRRSSDAQGGDLPAARAIRSAVLALLVVVVLVSPVWAAPVEVRFLEGVTRGFLVLRSTTGQIVGHGELLQTAHSDRVESRMIFRFKDGSLYDFLVVEGAVLEAEDHPAIHSIRVRRLQQLA